MSTPRPPEGFSTEHDALAIGATLDGKYKILDVLGMGGMGIVYLAENLTIGRTVAIKILRSRARRDASTLSRFRQEARASAAIGHPGIVDVLDMGETETGQGYIVMERLEGESLASRLKQRGSLSISEALSVICEALDAIAAAHEKGIIHRDLKPDNLFLVWRPKWCVKILDFGISRIDSDEDLGLTGSNMVMGSVLYMPPEQARDAHAAGPQADLYALGAVLYHALAGRPPFVGQNYSEVLSRVLADAHDPLVNVLPGTPAELSTLLDELLAKDPARRPATALGVRDRLLAMTRDQRPVAAPADALANTLPPPSARGVDATVAAPRAVSALGETAAARPSLALGETLDDSRPPTAPPSVAPARPSVEASASAAPAEEPHPAPARRRWWVVGAISVASAVTTIALLAGSSEDAAPAATDAATNAGLRPDAVQGPAFDAAVIDHETITPADAMLVDGPPVDARARPSPPRDAGARRIDAGSVPADSARPDAPPPIDAYVPLGLQPTGQP